MYTSLPYIIVLSSYFL